MLIQKSIESKLTEKFKPTHLQVVNESHKHHVPKDSETHFLVVVVSDQFLEVSRVQRQRMVYDCLDTELKNGVHALSQKLFTAAEWSKLDNQNFTTPNCLGGGADS